VHQDITALKELQPSKTARMEHIAQQVLLFTYHALLEHMELVQQIQLLKQMDVKNAMQTNSVVREV